MKTWKKIALPLTLAFGLAGCGESPQDLANKPALVRQMVENSASICDTGGDKSAYKQRLTSVLMGAKTANLQTLADHNVTACLDRRLPGVQAGFDLWHGTLDGVYYASKGDKDGGIVSLWDNGKPLGPSFTFMNTSSRGINDIKTLAGKINDGEQARDGGYMTGYEGKGGYVFWSVSDPTKGRLAKNPQLLKPPLKPAS